MQWYGVIEEFMGYLRVAKGASEHTLRNYRIDLKQFQEFLPEELPLGKVDRQHIRNFLAYLNRERKSRRTILRRLSSLRTFFKYARAEKWIVKDPCEEIESPRNPKKIPQFLTYDQVLTLLNQPDTTTLLGTRDRTMMELLYSSGLRVSELAGLNFSDLYLTESLIRIRGKGKKERVIPITQVASEWLTTYIDHPDRPVNPSTAIFLNHRGSRLTTRSIDRLFKNYLKHSGLSGEITPHTIRHTIATHWLEKGMNLKMIQTLLGHTSLTTTTLYTQVTSSLKRSVYDQTHPRS